MKRLSFTTQMQFNNILYIGDEPKECLSIIEKFNSCLTEIEHIHKGWFDSGNAKYKYLVKLQHHIHYHFEGGIAIFKFRNENDLPEIIRNECIIACKNLAAEQFIDVS